MNIKQNFVRQGHLKMTQYTHDNTPISDVDMHALPKPPVWTEDEYQFIMHDNTLISIAGLDKMVLLKALWDLPPCMSHSDATWDEKEADAIIKQIETEGSAYINFLCGHCITETITKDFLSALGLINERETLVKLVVSISQ